MDLWIVLPMAFAMDVFLGDPEYLPHPIRWMGKAITFFEVHFRKLPINLTLSGALFSISLVIVSWFITFIFVKICGTVHLFAGILVEIILIYYTISAKSLDDSAMAVYRSLKKGDLAESKNRLSLIVGRDVTGLDREGIVRATVETVGENLVDGFISPLFYAALGGAPLAMAYKMINTLDSMIGYKNPTYRHFGKITAKIDDIANFIPARLSVPVVSIAAKILSGCGLPALKTAIRDGKKHSSPNAGYPEAAFAGTLGIRLGGPNYYNGILVSKPFIGKAFFKTNAEDIKKACDLMLLSSLLWVGITFICYFCLSAFISG